MPDKDQRVDAADGPGGPGGPDGLDGPGGLGGVARSAPSSSELGETTVLGDARRADMGSARGEGLARGELVGRYTVLGRIGAGGMGVVYSAYDERLDRKVALKLMHANLGGTHASASTQGRHRMLREAQAMARLSHPNVVTVHEADDYGDAVFLAMEYVEGQSLAQWVQAQARPWQQVLEHYEQAAKGLGAAHDAGLVHRDFKPENVMVGNDGRVRVMDFGLARNAESTESGDSVSEVTDPGLGVSGALDDRVTRTGVAIGTPAYMSPEQHLGQPADARSDQFSYCVALWESLCGQRPYAGRRLAVLAQNVLQGRIEDPPRECKAPARIFEHLRRGLAANPDERWPDMRALSTALSHDPTHARRNLALGAGAMALAAGALWLAWPQPAGAEVCSGAQAKIDGAWSEALARSMQARFDASDLPFADSAYLATKANLDDWSVRWGAAHTDNCQATQLRKEQSLELMDLRAACLDRQRQSLAATVEVLVDADDAVIERAIRLSTALPQLSECSDSAALLQDVPPPSAKIADAVANAEAQVAKVRALETAGRVDDAARLNTKLGPEVQALAYLPLVARWSLAQAWIFTRQGDWAQAESSLLAAYRGARRAGAEETAIEAQALLVYVLGSAQSRHAEALTWGDNALADVDHHGAWGLLHAVLLTNLGSVHTGMGKYREAAARHREALAIYEETFINDHPRTAIALNNLGIALNEGGESKAAVEVHRRALAMRTKLFGDTHPDVATSLTNLGNAVRRLGEYDEAFALQTRALEIRERTMGPDHPRVAGAVGSLAIARAQRGEIDEAIILFRDCLARIQRGQGADSVAAADAMNNLAQALTMTEQFDEALRVQTRSLEIRTKMLGPEHPLVANSLNSLGELMFVQSRFEEAQAYVEQALELSRRSLGPSHPTVAAGLARLADIRLARGDAGAALGHFEAALEIREASEGDPADLAEARFGVARALRQLKREPKRVAELCDQVAAFYRERGESMADQLAEVERWRSGAKD